MTLEHEQADFIFDTLRVRKPNAVQSRQVICAQNASNLESDELQSSTQTAKTAKRNQGHEYRTLSR